MTKQQVINLGDRSTWECPTCESTEEMRSQQQIPNTPNNLSTNFRFKSATQVKLKILQLNIEAISAKKDELKKFLKKHAIDIMLLQETKMIPKDADPKFPGYTIIRKDRKQPKGKEKNR